MELTKQQIQYIDYRLENEGIKYWDILIEMLDHVVSDIENQLKPKNIKNEFNEIVTESFIALGWKENFNGGGLDHVFQKTINSYSKNNRNSFIKFYKVFLTDIKNIFFIGLFWLYLFAIHNNIQVLKYTFFTMLFLFSIGLVGFFVKYSIFKSTKLNSFLFLIFLPTSLLNVFMYWPKLFFGYEKLSGSYITIIIAIIVPFLAIGIHFLYKEFKSAEKIYKKMIS